MISFAPFSSTQSIFTPRNSPLKQPPSLFFLKSSPCFRVSCTGKSRPATADFVLHKALDSAGIDTTHAREARKGFMAEIEKLTAVERATSVTINKRVDLWKTALYIAAEDDSIISQSPVPVPVDYFARKVFPLAMSFCTEYSSSLSGASPEMFLDSLERFLYGSKGFRRSNESNQFDPATLYLSSVLMEGIASPTMLALIYSEILKVLRMWFLLDFDCEIFLPEDRYGVPRGYHKQKMKDSDQPRIVTTQILLKEILRNLKETFWPFQHDHSKSPFSRAVYAINSTHRTTSTEESGLWLASTTTIRNRLEHNTLKNVRSGDMRLALSACERLILLESDPKELRDYSILLYHCGFYDQSLQYLKLYKEREQNSSPEKQSSCGKCRNMEEAAVDNLMTRLKFISMEEGWSKPSSYKNFLQSNFEVI